MLLLEDSGKTNKVTMGADVTRREEKIHHGECREGGANRPGGERLECEVSSCTYEGIFQKLFFCMRLQKSPCVLKQPYSHDATYAGCQRIQAPAKPRGGDISLKSNDTLANQKPDNSGNGTLTKNNSTTRAIAQRMGESYCLGRQRS